MGNDGKCPDESIGVEDVPSAAEMVPRELLACTVFKGDFPFPRAGVFEG